jgi:glycerol-3-phosphate dehydrogenase
MTTRQEMWDALSGRVDVLVIGGGINGAGIARDAVRRGLTVALLEMNDLATGTSSRSSKLVHGGLRYLEHYEFSLVFEAVSERRILLDIAPHLVNPLGFLFPVYQNSKRKLWFINAGMWVYEGLSLFRSPKRHRSLKQADVVREEPSLKADDISGAPLYYDCSTDDARLTLENALDAAGQRAVVATWAKAVSFIRDERGRVAGAVVQDRFTKELKEVRANVVVNATGPWTDRTIAMSKALQGGSLLRPTKGVHIVVDSARLKVNNAIVCVHPEDGRVLFAIPWGERTYIGTTDTDFEGDPSEVHATREDVTYLLDAANRYFPASALTDSDVISTWAGLRPLMRTPEDQGDVSESSVSREHQIIVGADGLITVAGGKLTTYRRMSAEVVDTAVKLLRLSNQLPSDIKPARTDQEPLPGAVGWPADDDHARVAGQIEAASEGTVAADTARYLGDTYGMRGLDIARTVAANPSLGVRLVDGRPEILACVDWAVQHELAARVTDVMRRRTQLYYRVFDQGLAAAPLVAARMAELLGWSSERMQEEVDLYSEEVAASRAWRGQNVPSTPNTGSTGKP